MRFSSPFSLRSYISFHFYISSASHLSFYTYISSFSHISFHFYISPHSYISCFLYPPAYLYLVLYLVYIQHITNLSSSLPHTTNLALRDALTTRLTFRKAFLLALDLDRPLPVLAPSWNPVLELLPLLKTTQQLGTPVPGSFSTKIQRRLASTVPPRPVVELAFTDAFDRLKQLCLDCQAATRFVTELPADDPLEFENFLWHFGGRTPAPMPYARSYMANILFHPDTLDTPVPLPLLDVKSLVFPPYSPILDPENWNPAFASDGTTLRPPARARIAHLIDEFIQRAGQNYSDYWTALGQNPCRLRRMLIHVIEGWNVLQIDAEGVDEELSRCAEDAGIPSHQTLQDALSTWTYHKKLLMVEKVVILGFEQDIYLADEFAGMYHFLELVAKSRIKVLQTIANDFRNVAKSHEDAGRQEIAKDIEKEGAYVGSLLEQATATCHLAAALAMFNTVLLYLHLVPRPKRPFGEEELRYELRMRPFLTLQPPQVPPFEDYQKKIQPYGPYDDPTLEFERHLRDPSSEIWAQIDGHVKAAKDAFTKAKKRGAKEARASGVEKDWNKEVQGGGWPVVSPWVWRSWV